MVKLSEYLQYLKTNFDINNDNIKRIYHKLNSLALDPSEDIKNNSPLLELLERLDVLCGVLEIEERNLSLSEREEILFLICGALENRGAN